MRSCFDRLALAVLAGAAITAACAASLAVSAPAGRASLVAKAPPPLQMRDPCVRSAERKQVVRFTAADRTRLIGVMLGGGRRGVVLAHERGSTLCAWLPYARTLARLGFRVLAFDFRDHGSSGKSQLLRVDVDVRAAVGELRRRGARGVVLAGASVGGTAALAAATAVNPPVQGVISISAPRSLGPVDAEAAMPRLRVPALFIAAEDDQGFAEEARVLHQAAAAGDKRLEIVPAGGHGTTLLRIDRVRSLVTGFIREHATLG